jgi:hypothetical protein
MSEATRILSAIEDGDPNAEEQVYDELRKLAAGKLAQEKPGQTLQATALASSQLTCLTVCRAGNLLVGQINERP